MAAWTRQLGKTLAMVSFATMLMLQVVHSPLTHVANPCCTSTHGGSTEQGEKPHSHGNHSHSHCEVDSHAEHSHDDSCPSCPDDSCQLCQFLAQPADFVAPPVFLEGADLVAEFSERSETIFFGCLLGGPHVRGPPAELA